MIHVQMSDYLTKQIDVYPKLRVLTRELKFCGVFFGGGEGGERRVLFNVIY